MIEIATIIFRYPLTEINSNDMVEHAKFKHSPDGVIEDILREEMLAYFNLQKKLDDVIKIIQKRVNFYLEENR